MGNDKRTYEAMFLLDTGESDFHAASEPVRTALERSEAEVLWLKPWDDRRLAYEIEGRKRGLYVLTYFSVDPSRIGDIEHDCQLDERILRVLILQKDHVSETELQAETPAIASARRAEEFAAKREAEQQAKAAEQAKKQQEEASAATAEANKPPADAPVEEPEPAEVEDSPPDEKQDATPQGDAEVESK